MIRGKCSNEIILITLICYEHKHFHGHNITKKIELVLNVNCDRTESIYIYHITFVIEITKHLSAANKNRKTMNAIAVG